MSLTSCIKKAGKALHADDRATITAKARELRASGVGTDEAAMQAVEAQIAAVDALLTAPPARAAEAAPAPEPEQQKGPTEHQIETITRETEADLFTNLSSSASMTGKSIDEITAELQARWPNSAPFDVEKATKLAQAISKKVTKNRIELEKQKHRDPAVLSNAVAAVSAGVENVPAFMIGFQHALAGKTKSTLTGEDLDIRQSGYLAARDWMKTEEGAAWYEGRPVNKLTNTGVDLRRHWELMSAQMKASESDVKKAWAQIERATMRSDLFAPLIDKSTTPGLTLYIQHARTNTETFKAWLEGRDYDGEYPQRKSRWNRRGVQALDLILEGRRYPRGVANFQDDSGVRIAWLQEQARAYLALVKPFLEVFDGANSVKDAAERFDAKYMLPLAEQTTRHYENKLNTAGKAWHSNRVTGAWAGTREELQQMRSNSDWTQHLIEKEATIALPTRADPLTPPRLDTVKRDGPDLRKGENVTPEQAKKAFGFADIGFGKWVGAKQDQDHLNYASDAFHDLAKHFGMDPVHIGFGGQLHFTIGALGHGKFAAHFQSAQPSPGGPVQVINVTNTKGDGTVYHEWVHALDHNLGGEWTRSVRPLLLDILKRGIYTVDQVEQRARDFLFGGWHFKGDKRAGKIDAALRGLDYRKDTLTTYKTDADQLGKDYWGNDAELIARAGEAWAVDTLKSTNTYLVNPSWAGDGMVTAAKGYRGTPYPTGDERRIFADAYTALAKSVKWADGKPTVSLADFKRNLPDEFSAGQKRREELQIRSNMEVFQAEEAAKRAEAEGIKEQQKADNERAEREAMDALAAEKLAALTPDPAPVAETPGDLSRDDLYAMFNEAAAELREERQEQPAAPAPGMQAEPSKAAESPAAAELISKAAALGVKGASEALSGLAKLFGGSKGGRLNSFGAGFDEETYKQALPHFKAALQAFQEAGKTLKDLFKMLIGQFGDGIADYAVRFAEDEKLSAKLGSAPSASMAVADRVAQRLAAGHAFDWRTLFAIADEAFGGTQAEGKYTPKDAYDAMEAGVNTYLMRNGGRGFNPNASREVALMTTAALEKVTAMLPTQTKRTAEQDEFQQFSTVTAFAHAAVWAANVTDADTMLEPSAGIGGLAVFARNAGAKLVLNELSSRRAAVLQDVFPGAKVFQENAEQIDNILPDDIKPTVVVMNPPFSSSAGRMQGERKTEIGAQHIDQALGRLVDGGRLVAIVGQGMALDKPTFKDWWAKTRSKYDVRAVIPVDGAGYVKYGTTFDQVLLIIDKIKPVEGRKIVTDKVNTYADLIGLTSEIRDERPPVEQPADQRAGVERNAAESERGPLADGGEAAAAGGAGAGEAADLGAGAEPGGRQGLDGRGGGRRQPSGKGRPAGDVLEPSNTRDRVGGDAGRGGDRVAESGGGPVPEGSATGVVVSAGDQVAAALTDSVFEAYKPQRLEVNGAKPHPGALVQSAALASVLPPAATYTPNLPKATIKDGKLSIAQIETVVYAGQAHEQVLDRTVDANHAATYGTKVGEAFRRGFFVGDGTGVGKGREIGGIILDNLRQGRKKAVWVTEKQGLMADAKRDFKGIGGDEGLIFNQNKTGADGRIDAKDGIIFTTYATLRSGAVAAKVPSGPELMKQFGAGAVVKIANNDANYELASIDLKKGILLVDNVDTGRTGLRANFDRVESIGGVKDWQKGNPAATSEKKKAPSRLDQLVDWLGKDYDGVIALDEAHNAGNAVAIKGERGASEPSAQAMAVVELQERLPNARVVYVSATGATEVSNLSFATRLGLWGTGTPFPAVQSFIDNMNAGGLATMELVARDMKQMGAYIARSLSFDGVTYSRVEHELTPIQRDIYDRLAEGWQVTLRDMLKALEITGATTSTGSAKDKNAKRNAKSAYWGAQQRFFNQIITAMQMPTAIESIERDLANGDAVVLQLVNTNEAQQERALTKRKDDDEVADDLEDLDLTPRDQLIGMVEKSFPTAQYEDYNDENGKRQIRPVMKADGTPVENKEALAMKARLLEDLKQIRVPDGPLEIILNHFGPKIVAEVTGRGQRVVRKPDADGNIKAQLETRGGSAARSDAEAFMADKKSILVFSDAGGTGYSFHADLTKSNQRKRRHYLIQPGWRANKAVQGLGRTHRTNEASQPEYKLVSTDIPAQKRFLSSIARRLDQLGALSSGQRDAANQGLFSEKDNLESKYATQAVKQLVQDVRAGQIKGLSFDDFLHQLGLEDIVNEDTKQIPEDKYPPTRQFLNRMLSLKLDMQALVFDAFIQRMEEKVELANQQGTLDVGMQTIRALESKTMRDEVVYSDPRTGAETRYVELELTQATHFFKFPQREYEAARNRGDAEFVINAKSGRVWLKIKSGTTTKKDGSVVDRYWMMGTNGGQSRDAAEVDGDNFEKATTELAREVWDAENAKRPATYVEREHMIVGAMLPIWDRLKTDGVMRIARTQTVDGQRLLGRVVNKADLGDILKRLNVESAAAKMKPADLMAEVLKGNKVELANGWTLERAKVSDDLRIELKNIGYSSAVGRELTGFGALMERINWADRYFIPTSKEGAEVLGKILKTRPAVEIKTPEDSKEKGSASLSLAGRVEGMRASTAIRSIGGSQAQAVGKLQDNLNAELKKKVALQSAAPKVGEQTAAVDLIKTMFGKELVYFTSDRPLAHGVFSHTQPGYVFVNAEHGDKALFAILGHEMLHALRHDRPDLYGMLASRMETVIRHAHIHGDVLNARRDTHGMPHLGQDKLTEEFLGDVAGDNWKNSRFWYEIAKDQPSKFVQVIRSILKFVDGIITKLLGQKGYYTEQYLSDLKEARAAMAEAFSAYSKGVPQLREGAGSSLSTASAPNFYSALTRQVERAGMTSAPAQGWLDWLKGLTSKGAIKADEVEWTGLDDWLKMQTGKVSREQVMDFLNANGVKVAETVLSDGGSTDLPEGWRVRLAREDDDAGNFALVLADENNQMRGAGNTSAEAIEDGWDADSKSDTPTKYSQYTLPGGSHYREVLLTLPTPRSPLSDEDAVRLKYLEHRHTSGAFDALPGKPLFDEMQALRRKKGPKPAEYLSGHWDQPNVLAHIRLNDRTDADGKRVLFVEELQSDWQQEARKKGFPSQVAAPTRDELKADGWDVEEAVKDPSKPSADPSNQGFKTRRYLSAQTGPFANTADEAWAALAERVRAAKASNTVPEAPFIGSTEAWLRLALKRVIKMAVDEGYDRVAFVTGEQSADRYDLSKQISKVRFDSGSSGGVGKGDPDSVRGLLYAYGTNGYLVMEKYVDGAEEIADNVGKEIADRLLHAEFTHTRSSGGIGVVRRELAGLDLKVGGEGMRAFYDKIVPSVLKDVLRKVGGGTPVQVTLEKGADRKRRDEVLAELGKALTPELTQPGFDITPAMREKAAGGLPMFSVKPSIDFSLADTKEGSTQPADLALKTLVSNNLKKAGNRAADFRGVGLQFLGRMQLTERFSEDIPAMKRYSAMVDQMDADKNEAGAEADTLAVNWGKLSDEEDLAALMHDATVAGIDPEKDWHGKIDAATHERLKTMFDALSPEARETYIKARDMYEAHINKVHAAIKDKIERSMPESKRRTEMLEKMDTEFFGKVKGVYFPLARFGDYVVAVKNGAGEVLSATRAETLNEAEAVRAALLKDYADNQNAKVGKVLKSAEFNAARDMVSKGFVKDLFDVLEAQAVPADVFDSINQLYLQSLPSLSWAKHGIHRKGTPGFSQDARRAFAAHMFHGARHLAKLRYSDRLNEGLESMQAQVNAKSTDAAYDSVRAQQVVDEMVKRHETLMNPKSNPLSTALTSFGFVFHLGLSPASAITNLAQTPMVAYPLMGAKWGFGKSASALMAASREAAVNKNDMGEALEGDEKRAFDSAVSAGLIDVTQAHDLAGIAQGEDSKLAHKLRPVMRAASFLFHHAEKFNRQATFMAAYRLARTAGADHGTAYAEAYEITYQGHFNYSSSNRPRIMQGNAAKVLLLFKQFGQNMVYTLYRQAELSLKGATPAERKQARKALAGLLVTHAAGAGVLGLPMVTTLLAVASMLGSSDDEPWDAEVALRNQFADVFGQTAGEAMAHGLTRLTPWDMSGRIGLNHLILPDLQEGLQGQRLGESAMAAALGPVAGIGINVLKGLQAISEGHWGLGLETMMPSALRGPMRAYRYGTEGAVDKTGVPIKEEVGAAGVVGQAFGFAPSEVREATEARSAIYQADNRLMSRRKALTVQFAMATIAGDREGMVDARDAINQFNRTNPRLAINGSQMAASVKARLRRISQAEEGVYLPSNRRGALESGRFSSELQ